MNITKVLAGVCAVLAFWLWWVIDDYGGLKSNYKSLLTDFNDQVSINQSYQTRIQSLNELDTKHTKELTNAKAEINKLRTAAERNPERVYIKASCPKAEGVTTSGLDDAITARPTDSAIRNYWLLRERIAESEQMIRGLQEYINHQCFID